MDALVDFVDENWDALWEAPGAFFVLFVLAVAAGFAFARFLYRDVSAHRVAAKDATIEKLRADVDSERSLVEEYRQRLGLADPSTVFEQMSNDEVRRKALDLADGIRTYANDWMERSFRESEAMQQRWIAAESKEEKKALWQEERRAILRTHPMKSYEERYLVDSLALRHEIAKRLPDGESPIDAFRYEHPTNPLGMKEVAADLERTAKILP